VILRKSRKEQVKENQAYGGEGLYAGFRIIEMEDERPNEEDEPYVGAFVPLEVAQRFPGLILRATVEYEEVLSDDKLPGGTRVVVAPGQFKPLRSTSGCLALLLIVVVAGGVLAS
jgi:hypothetical protein